MQSPPEKLGSFFLGAEYDLKAGKRNDEAPVNYDARDLVTHAVVVGMTGSGKTGLCVDLLEEAALDRVPAIMIDPKGDITNLLLQFPDLLPENFKTWINEDDARRKGQTVDEFAAATAETWAKGLADWGQNGERIRAVQESVEYTIFTPGSDAGIPINILGSLAAPKVDWESEGEAIRERISGTVAALLGLADIDADPVRSKEGILLASIFEHYWKQGVDLDLAKLIMSIQSPPVRQIGVFDVDTFFPEKERFPVAMAFNNLVASSTFQYWLQGEPLDIDQIYFTKEGKPRHSIFYIAHLSDSERMFFVTLLLENVLTWVRRQSGTTSLRALLYFDEIFGYFPPTANPPSKRPLLTLMKQARAFGLGVVLVTQNPVDLDYKGLTNAGTWLIGKLQAERDKERVLAGLQGAIAEQGGNSDLDYDELITRLNTRVFLMHNVHASGPVVFTTRWAMSYLRGPLTRPQVRQLMSNRKALMKPVASRAVVSEPVVSRTVASESVISNQTPVSGLQSPVAEPQSAIGNRQSAIPAGLSVTPPSLDSAVEQVFLPIVLGDAQAVRHLAKEEGTTINPKVLQLIYEPALVGKASVRFLDRARGVDQQMDRFLIAPPPEGIVGVDWGKAEPVSITMRDLLRKPEQVEAEQGPFFASAPEKANSASKLKSITSDFSDWMYYNNRLQLSRHKELGLSQKPGETERDFRIRLQQAARERRDAEVDKLEKQLETQLTRIEDKLQKEQRELAANEAEHGDRKREELVGIGETVLSWVLGRRSMRGISSAASKRRMTSQVGMDIEESKEEIAELTKAKEELEAQLKEQIEQITLKWANLLDDLSSEELAPRRNDVQVEMLALGWLPSWRIEYEEAGRVREATIAAYQMPEVG